MPVSKAVKGLTNYSLAMSNWQTLTNEWVNRVFSQTSNVFDSGIIYLTCCLQCTIKTFHLLSKRKIIRE